MITHPIAPIYDSNSKILILGSFPSVKSREEGFFYGHKQNRFWKVIAKIFNTQLPTTIEDKKKVLLENRVALWDVIASCNITGSSDSSIKDAVPNDLTEILNNSNVKYIFTNGKKADELYRKYLQPSLNIPVICLPSTSPANAAYSLEKLYQIWNNEIGKVMLNE